MAVKKLTKSEARQEAESCRLLLGEGWQIDLWSNSPPPYWHWRVFRSRFSVFPSYRSRGAIHYVCRVSHSESSVGSDSPVWSQIPAPVYKDPRNAVRAAAKRVEDYYRWVRQVHMDAQGICDDLPVASRKNFSGK